MSFDRVATFFAPLEWLAFQGAMQRARSAQIDALDSCARLLVLGEGDGRFLAALARHRIERGLTQPLSLEVVESSAAMRRRCETRLTPLLAEARLELDLGPGPWDPAGEEAYDAVVTCFFLDCFGPMTLDQLIPQLAARLRPGGTWLFADFQIPPQGWAHGHARFWSWLLHRFFRATTGIESTRLADFAARLGAAGLRLERHRHFRWEFIRSDLWRKPQ
jgi:cyclopropane fatty-acyl-phospholipid synthase-like methyltransferase